MCCAKLSGKTPLRAWQARRNHAKSKIRCAKLSGKNAISERLERSTLHCSTALVRTSVNTCQYGVPLSVLFFAARQSVLKGVPFGFFCVLRTSLTLIGAQGRTFIDGEEIFKAEPADAVKKLAATLKVNTSGNL